MYMTSTATWLQFDASGWTNMDTCLDVALQCTVDPPVSTILSYSCKIGPLIKNCSNGIPKGTGCIVSAI